MDELPRELQLLVLRKARLSIDQRRGLGIGPGTLRVPDALARELGGVLGRLRQNLTFFGQPDHPFSFVTLPVGGDTYYEITAAQSTKRVTLWFTVDANNWRATHLISEYDGFTGDLLCENVRR